MVAGLVTGLVVGLVADLVEVLCSGTKGKLIAGRTGWAMVVFDIVGLLCT